MAAETKNILIFGATGLIGEHITRGILDKKDRFNRIGIFTSSDTVRTKSVEIDHLKSQGVEVITGNLTSEDAVKEAYNGFDTVVSCVGRPVIHHQLKLIELTDQHSDIKCFFPSEYGTDIEYSPASVDEKPHQQKLKVRALFKTVKNLQYTYVVTGPYGDADGGLYLSARPPENEAGGTFDVKRKRAVLLGDGNGKVSLTTMRDVGKLVAAALLHSDAVKNRALRVNSFTATPKAIVAEFEKQTGGQQWDVGYTSLDTLEELEQQAWAANDPKAGSLTLRRIWTEGGTLYEQRDNELIGMEEGVASLQDAVKQAIETRGPTTANITSQVLIDFRSIGDQIVDAVKSSIEQCSERLTVTARPKENKGFGHDFDIRQQILANATILWPIYEEQARGPGDYAPLRVPNFALFVLGEGTTIYPQVLFYEDSAQKQKNIFVRGGMTDTEDKALQQLLETTTVMLKKEAHQSITRETIDWIWTPAGKGGYYSRTGIKSVC